jgi:hypothetical protein
MKEKCQMENPCEICLVRAVCNNKIFVDGWLIIELVKKCPFIAKYLNKEELKHKEYYKRIDKICDVFNVEHKFMWYPPICI